MKGTDHPFWTQERRKELEAARQVVLDLYLKKRGHPALVGEYDPRLYEALVRFSCGLIKIKEEDFSYHPYPTGVQIRGVIEMQEIRFDVPGSEPKGSFFGEPACEGNTPDLYICESPIEAIYLWQRVGINGGSDVLSTIERSPGLLSEKQCDGLVEMTAVHDWKYIHFVINDSTGEDVETLTSLSNQLNDQANLHVADVTKFCNGRFTTLTQFITISPWKVQDRMVSRLIERAVPLHRFRAAMKETRES